jgi:hypothetical protein
MKQMRDDFLEELNHLHTPKEGQAIGWLGLAGAWIMMSPLVSAGV